MALHIEHLKKQYIGPDGSVVPVIDIESMSLADGEQVALIGTSGSGKTTLLHMIAGIVAPDSGQIIYDFRGLPSPHAPPGRPRSGGTIDYRSAGNIQGTIDIAQA